MVMYALVNYYLSSIQQGIQAAHAVVEMSRSDTDSFKAWRDKDKTLVILNGGNNQGLQTIKSLLENSSFLYSEFHEDEQSLGGVLTALAVLPNDEQQDTIDFYRMTSAYPSDMFLNHSIVDGEVIRILATSNLAK